jgi:hypothetical protein
MITLSQDNYPKIKVRLEMIYWIMNHGGHIYRAPGGHQFRGRIISIELQDSDDELFFRLKFGI